MKNIIILLITLVFFSCSNKKAKETKKVGEVSGDLIVFHAGSLSLPLKQVFDDFKKQYPKVNILAEAAGSRDCARKISDLGRPCDVFLSADFQVINQLLIPQFASWSIFFANNEMVIAYTPKAKYAKEMNATNWTQILQDPAVRFGRSNPDSDPCGYRSVFVMKLAQIYYSLPVEFNDKMLFKDLEYVRPKETDLLALLETNTVDYIFIYKSVAVQHKLNYITLPNEVNLSKVEMANYYQQVEVKLSGKKPGEFISQMGEPIVYGITVPKSARNYDAAEAFVDFFLTKEKGQKTMEVNGQHSIVPSSTNTYTNIPLKLRKFAQK